MIEYYIYKIVLNAKNACISIYSIRVKNDRLKSERTRKNMENQGKNVEQKNYVDFFYEGLLLGDRIFRRLLNFGYRIFRLKRKNVVSD